jgi:L-lysine 2,3-aminomutase
MKNAIRSSSEMYSELGIAPSSIQSSDQGESEFPVFVPLEFLRRMRKGDTNDPLLLQVTPLAAESIVDAGYVLDPVGDTKVERAPGLLHKYSGRVLMIVTGACGVHCRYCFRRHYTYSTAPKSIAQWQSAIEYIESDPTIHEVILSGGDPLTVVDDTLSQLVARLDRISHLKRLRIHTRMPVVIPQRVDASLCAWLEESRLAKWIVLHINHAQEIDSHVVHSVRRLQSTGSVVLNQAVLLRGVNDSVEVLAALCERLVDINVLPYYLHQLDRVAGATHFAVDRDLGRALVGELAKRLPGFAVPKFVEEIAGEASKSMV